MKQLLALLMLLCLPSWAWAVGVLTPAAGDATFMVAERSIETPSKVMVNADVVFTITGGAI